MNISKFKQECGRKLKALMLIAMLTVAEGRRVNTNIHIADAFESSGSSTSHGVDKREGEALDSKAPLELDLLLKDC